MSENRWSPGRIKALIVILFVGGLSWIGYCGSRSQQAQQPISQPRSLDQRLCEVEMLYSVNDWPYLSNPAQEAVNALLKVGKPTMALELLKLLVYDEITNRILAEEDLQFDPRKPEARVALCNSKNLASRDLFVLLPLARKIDLLKEYVACKEAGESFFDVLQKRCPADKFESYVAWDGVGGWPFEGDAPVYERPFCRRPE